MKPIYFCGNCKQYHASCLKQNQSQVSSVNYLRFSDLFNAKPRPHLQNFTPTAKFVDNSRLVYEEDQRTVGKSRGMIGRSNKQYLPTGLSQSRLTAEGRSHARETGKKIHATIYLTSNKLKTEYNDRTQKFDTNLSASSKRQKLDTKSIKKKQKGPYYIIEKLHRNENLSKQKIEVTQDTTLLSNNKTPTKTSYVYGDSNRKILKPKKQTKQFDFGQLVQSHQEEQELKFLQPPPLENKPKIVQHTIKLNGSTSEKRNQLAEGKDNKNNMEYLNKMGELKSLLSSNSKKYSQTNTKRYGQGQSQMKFSRQDKYQQKYQKTDSENLHQLLTPTNQYSNPIPTSTSAMVNKSPATSQPARKENNGKNCCKAKDKCKYFDNRCLGLGFCQEGQIDFAQSRQDLL